MNNFQFKSFSYISLLTKYIFLNVMYNIKRSPLFDLVKVDFKLYKVLWCKKNFNNVTTYMTGSI